MTAIVLLALLASTQATAAEAATAALDPRIAIVEAQSAGRNPRQALDQVERVIAEQPEWSRQVGLPYLEGRLLSRIGRNNDALQVFIRSARLSPDFQSEALLEVARGQMQAGHPEVAAGVLAAILRSPASEEQRGEAASLMVLSLNQGADCGVLARVPIEDQGVTARRRLEIARIDCQLVKRSDEKAILLGLLTQNGRDLVSMAAADRLNARWGPGLDDSERTLLGNTFHQHRDFKNAVLYLEPVVSRLPRAIDRKDFDLYYSYVRSWFWQGEFERAESGYTDLAARSERSEDQARSLYNRARSLELLGNWQLAAEQYRRAFLTDEFGDLSGSAMLAALRLEWRRGRETEADDLLVRLPSDRRWRAELSRTRLFLASSDIVRGRGDRAGYWLKRAESSKLDTLEVSYWSGRLAELENQDGVAVRHYFAVLLADAYHPLARSALTRLRTPSLVEAAAQSVQGFTLGHNLRELALAAIVLDPGHPATSIAGERLRERLLAGRTTRAVLELETVPTAEWPLWQSALSTPAERFLALGLWREGESAVRTHFPLDNLRLAYTAAQGLASDDRPNRSIYIAEILADRIPRDIPPWFLPSDLRKLIYPAPWSDIVQRETTAADVDPFLLLAILREESRFDRQATSPASARGLAQFIYPTAVQIAAEIGLANFSSEDLEDPKIAIRLAAAYLAKLDREFDPNTLAMVAAYNAGETQVKLWQALCFSQEPEEFYSKIGFKETRDYVGKVLRSRNQYREIHGKALRP